MVYPGTKCPRDEVPKKGQETRVKQSNGSKQEKDQMLMDGESANVGPAPSSRIFTRDYSKVGRSKGDTDSVTAALGSKPLGW